MFKTLYYSLIDILSSIRSNDNPLFNAYVGISFFQCLNVITLIGLVNYFGKFDISKKLAVIIGLLLYLIITCINFFVLYKNRDRIILRIKNNSNFKPRRFSFLLFIYSFISVALFIIVLAKFVTPKF